MVVFFIPYHCLEILTLDIITIAVAFFHELIDIVFIDQKRFQTIIYLVQLSCLNQRAPVLFSFRRYQTDQFLDIVVDYVVFYSQFI